MAESSFLNPATVVRAAGVHEGMRVADFGAGSGFFTRAAARAAGPGGVVWAVDIRRDLLSRIKNISLAEGLRNVEIIHGDIEHIGGTHLPEASFNYVFVCNALFAVECRSCLAEEAARVLKQGGKVVLVDWAGSFGGLGPPESHVVPAAEARAAFEAHGFVYADAIPPGRNGTGAYHWGCILKKKK